MMAGRYLKSISVEIQKALYPGHPNMELFMCCDWEVQQPGNATALCVFARACVRACVRVCLSVCLLQRLFSHMHMRML